MNLTLGTDGFRDVWLIIDEKNGRFYFLSVL